MVATITLLCTIYIYMNIAPVKLMFVLFHIMFLKKYPGSTVVLKHCMPATVDAPKFNFAYWYHLFFLYTLHIIHKIHCITEMKGNMELWMTKKEKKNLLGKQQQSQV